MDLWIRSQDKRDLVKVKEIHFDIALPNGEVGIKGYFEDKLYKMLGYYKKEKRVLEVLDEIEDLMRSLNSSDLKIIIYEMPEV